MNIEDVAGDSLEATYKMQVGRSKLAGDRPL
jgi:hypothetical protein